MSLPSVNISLGQGGLGQPQQNFDGYSALIAYYNASTATAGYSTIGNKVYNSIADAESDGVVKTYAEATAGTVIDTVAVVGTNGDVVTLTFTSFDGSIIALGSYTKVSGDTTPLLVATAIVASINSLTYLSGFSAVLGALGAYTVTAPKKLGIFVNAKSITYTYSAGATLSVTSGTFTGGTKSWLRIWHYQISEYFRKNSTPLYFSIKLDNTTVNTNVGLFNTQLTADILSVQNAWSGNARRIGISSTGRTFATSTLDAIKSAYDTLLSIKMPASFFFVGDNTATSLSAQPNLSALTDDGIVFLEGQSGSGTGLELSKTQMQVIGTLGLALGVKSSGAISQSIAEVGAFQLSNGTECETAVFLDGTAFGVGNKSLNDQLNDYGYVFLRKFVNATGTFFSNSVCATTPSSDYKYVELAETIHKAVRGVYASILPLLNARNTLNSNGTLSKSSISAYQSNAGYALTQMFVDGDISQDPATNGGIVVSATEVVSVSSNIPITISLIPRGYGRKISITIGYVAKI